MSVMYPITTLKKKQYLHSTLSRLSKMIVIYPITTHDKNIYILQSTL